MSCPVRIGTTLLKSVRPPMGNDQIHDKKAKQFKEKLSLDPMHLKRVRISALAAIRIIMHANKGVKDGLADPDRQTPVEVMGELLGFVDKNDPETLIISDSFIVPCKGGAHSAVPDERTELYKDEMRSILEKTNKKARSVGWYHSHPFDPLESRVKGGGHHCWFSAQDVTTQTMSQGLYDSLGSHWVGIVVDPQTSMKKRQLHFGCFRIYNRYDAVPDRIKMKEGRTPDGVSLGAESLNVTRWGPQWDKYYALDVSFYTNLQNMRTLRVLNSTYGWINDLVSSKSLDPSYKKHLNTTMAEIGVDAESTSLKIGQASSRGSSATQKTKQDKESSPFDDLVKMTSELGVEVAVGGTKQVATNILM